MNKGMPSKYEIIKPLGQGSFGSAFLIKNKNDNKNYVLKNIPLETATKEEIKYFQNEAKILSSLNSNYIVKFYESFTYNNTFNIIMEFCQGLDLKKFIQERKKENKLIDIKEIYNIIIEICLGLKEIHTKNLIHRDIKPDNIFLTKNLNVKIGDFGIAKILDAGTQYAKTTAGSMIYMAPELINGKKYNNKVDIWALGCILYELCTFNLCYRGNCINEICNKILNKKYNKFSEELYGIKMQTLLDLLFTSDYKKRPSAQEIIYFIRNWSISDGIYLIFPENSKNIVLNINDGNLNDNAQLVTWVYHNGNNQKFEFSYNISEGNYKIKVLHSNKFLTLDNTSKIIQYRDCNNSNQKWNVIKYENNYEIISVSTGKSLEVYQNQTSPGIPLICFSREGKINQRFRLINTEKTQPLPDGVYIIHPQNCSDKVLDIDYANPNDYGQVIIWNFLNRDNQKFKIESIDSLGIFYTIKPLHSGRPLTVDGTKKIIQYHFENTPNQLWSFVKVGDNFEIISKYSWQAMTVNKNKTKCGTHIISGERNGQLNQLFKFEKV